ncbi:perlucin-like protein [Penaeus monodon]|uniref:perlucin-like protein n=1 Tax=Penaeus monodon TaxID=6687 RepID=UPI0018A7A366|nr:perlucin-like protein [Penaeus monodon]
MHSPTRFGTGLSTAVIFTMKSLAPVILTALFSVAASASVRATDCPSPYEPLDETRCIFVDAYVAYTWQDTVDLCKTHGGEILTIEDCETFALVYDYVRSQDVTKGKHYWLGATDEEEEGTWKYVNNRPIPMGVPFWSKNEPNSGNTYNCAIMHASINHYWSDIPCGNKYNPICLKNY